MDIKSTLLGIIFILLIGLPIAAYAIHKISKEKQFFKKITLMADDQNFSISEYDIWSDSVIAMDNEKRRIFFYNKSMDKENPVIMDLEKIKECRLNIYSRYIDGNKIIDKLNLTFSFLDKKIPETEINFFNSHEKPQITGEYQLVEKWEKLINTYL